MRKALILLTFLTSANTTFCQTFKGEVGVPTVESDGFYKIFISPQIGSHLNADFTNIRIYDQQNKEVPYLLQIESPIYYSPEFKEYEIVEKKQIKDCCTTLMLRNPDGHAINNISLSIKNADVTKQASLVGSDDRKNWFALKQLFILNAIDNKNKTSEIKIVDFPLSNYSYYLLEIEDSTSAPLNILSAGYYKAATENGKYTEVSISSVSKSDSLKEKKTYVQIKFDSAQVIDKLNLSMLGATYYLRNASLYTKNERKNRKGGKEFYYDMLYNFELSSKQPTVIEFQGIRINELLITIENEDNPSLEISFLKVYQLNRYLTTYLKKENHYMAKVGGPELQAPIYDLGFFKDSIPANPQVLALGSLTIYEGEAQEQTTIFTSRLVIWVAIIMVIIMLGFMSVKLIREASESKKEG